MTNAMQTIGQAIDQMVTALSPLEKRQQLTAINAVCAVLEIELHPLTQPLGVRKESQSPSPHAERLEIAPISDPVVPPPGTKTSGPVSAPAVTVVSDRKAERSVDIRALKQEKNPESARQMACIVAFYLAEHAPEKEKKNTVSVADVEKYFKQAGYPLSAKMEQLLLDCKRAGYFESAANRGEYKLTRVGYNLVAHSLPKTGKSA